MKKCPQLLLIAVNFALKNNLSSNLDKAICHGYFGNKDHGNQIIKRDLKAKLEYYHPS